MNSLIRRSATVILVGATLIGTVLAGSLEVLALTQDQILQKLRRVPMFTIANGEGAPLVASPPSGQKGNPVAPVFVNPQDAQSFLDNLKGKNPALAKNVKVVPVSLAEVYQLNLANKDKKDKLDFRFVPSKQQVDTAQTLLKQANSKDQFNGTPLFVARGGPEKGYLTIQQGDKLVIPMYFKKEELQTVMDQFKQQDPKLGSNLEIQVLNLEGIIEVMRTQNDPQLDQIMLIPSPESREFVRTMSGTKPQPAQVKPAPAKK